MFECIIDFGDLHNSNTLCLRVGCPLINGLAVQCQSDSSPRVLGQDTKPKLFPVG